MDLMEMFGKRFRVTVEESFNAEKDTEERRAKWRYYEIRGHDGYVYPFGWNKPAVCFTNNHIGLKIARFRGAKWVRVQSGDNEAVFLIPMDDLEFAIRSIKPRRKRFVSEKELNRLRAMSAIHSPLRKNASVNPPIAGNLGPEAAG